MKTAKCSYSCYSAVEYNAINVNTIRMDIALIICAGMNANDTRGINMRREVLMFDKE